MMQVCAVWDVKAAAFSTPMFFATAALAVRAFSSAVEAPRSPLAEHPADFSMLRLGEFDPNSGKFTCLATPEFLCSASSVIAQVRAARLAVEPGLPGVLEEVSK